MLILCPQCHGVITEAHHKCPTAQDIEAALPRVTDLLELEERDWPVGLKSWAEEVRASREDAEAGLPLSDLELTSMVVVDWALHERWLRDEAQKVGRKSTS